METAVRIETPVRVEMSTQVIKTSKMLNASISHIIICSSMSTLYLCSVDLIMKAYNVQSQQLLTNIFTMFDVLSC